MLLSKLYTFIKTSKIRFSRLTLLWTHYFILIKRLAQILTETLYFLSILFFCQLFVKC